MRDETIILGEVPTYIGDGHSDPYIPVEVKIGQGVDITLKQGTAPNIYLERLPKKWSINISPTGDEIHISVYIVDNGKVIVKDKEGQIICEYQA